MDLLPLSHDGRKLQAALEGSIGGRCRVVSWVVILCSTRSLQGACRDVWKEARRRESDHLFLADRDADANS